MRSTLPAVKRPDCYNPASKREHISEGLDDTITLAFVDAPINHKSSSRTPRQKTLWVTQASLEVNMDDLEIAPPINMPRESLSNQESPTFLLQTSQIKSPSKIKRPETQHASLLCDVNTPSKTKTLRVLLPFCRRPKLRICFMKLSYTLLLLR